MPSSSSASKAADALSSPFAVTVIRAEGPFDLAAELNDVWFSSFQEAENALLPIAKEAELHSGENHVLMSVEHVTSNTRFTLRIDIDGMPVALEKRIRDHLQFMTTEPARAHLRKLHGKDKAATMSANARSWHRLLVRTQTLREESLRATRRNGSLHRALALANEAVSLTRAITRSLDQADNALDSLAYTDLIEATQSLYRAADHYLVFCKEAAPGHARRAHVAAVKTSRTAREQRLPSLRGPAMSACAKSYAKHARRYAEAVLAARGDREYGTLVSTYAELARLIAQHCI